MNEEEIEKLSESCATQIVTDYDPIWHLDPPDEQDKTRKIITQLSATILTALQAVHDSAIEQAAGVAEDTNQYDCRDGSSHSNGEHIVTCRKIATAIRSLKVERKG